MRPIKVAIFDQSQSFLKEIQSTLTDPMIKKVSTFTSLIDGLEAIKKEKPDVLLLDVNIPERDGKTALELILDIHFLPVLIVAGNSIFETAKTVQAMNQGAVDYFKMDNEDKLEISKYKHELVDKIIHARKGKPRRSFKRTRMLSNSKKIWKEKEREIERKTITGDKIVVIGSSTGGPRALQKVLQHIPCHFRAPILIVQHMPEKFTKSLANRLNNISKLKVKEAEHGETIKEGIAYIAPGNYHMRVKQKGSTLKINITKDEERLGHRPSVNNLFDSVASIKNYRKIAVVLTGMGKDGAEGVQEIKRYEDDAIIIAESKETAIIHGMPNAVIETNCVTEVLHLDQIADALIDYTET